MVDCVDGSQSDLLVRLPGTSLVYDKNRDGFPLNIALLEHGFNRKEKIAQVSEKRDRLSNFLLSWIPESKVYAGVSYVGSKCMRLDHNTAYRGNKSIDFYLQFDYIPKCVCDVWLPEDTLYVASRAKISEHDIAQIVKRGVYPSRNSRETISRDGYAFFSERLMTRILITSLESFRDSNTRSCDNIFINHNIPIDYNNSLRETDVVFAFWNISAFRKLLYTAARLTRGLCAKLSPELNNG